MLIITKIILITFSVFLFGYWLVKSYREFRKMEENPDDYSKKKKVRYWIEKPKPVHDQTN